MSEIEQSGNDMVLLSNKRISDILINVLVSETHNDTVKVSDHPVQRGSPISDHAYVEPRKVSLECAWSNADERALQGFAVAANDKVNGAPTSAQYVDSVYARLLALQESREPFELVTGRRRYTNMLIESLSVKHERGSAGAIRINIGLREVRVVNVSESDLPPPPSQAQPASTAQTRRKSSKAPVPTAPLPTPSSAPSMRA